MFAAHASDGVRFLERVAAHLDVADLRKLEQTTAFDTFRDYFEFDKILAPLGERQFPVGQFSEFQMAIGDCGYDEIAALAPWSRLYVAALYIFCSAKKCRVPGQESDYYHLVLAGAVEGGTECSEPFLEFMEWLHAAVPKDAEYEDYYLLLSWVLLQRLRGQSNETTYRAVMQRLHSKDAYGDELIGFDQSAQGLDAWLELQQQIPLRDGYCAEDYERILRIPRCTEYKGELGLAMGITHGRLERVEELLASGVDPQSHHGHHDYSPVCWAASLGRPEILEALLRAGADPERVSNNGATPLHSAANGEDRVACLRVLLAAGARTDTQDAAAALGSGAGSNRADVVRLLLDAGVLVSARDEEVSGGTALMAAAKEGHTEMVLLLLSRGADATATDHRRTAALHWCAMRCDAPDVIELLVDAGAALEDPDDRGYTPLYLAAMMSRPGALRALLRHGADAQPHHPKYGTALEYVVGARNEGWEEIAALLRAALDPEPAERSVMCEPHESFLDELQASTPGPRTYAVRRAKQASDLAQCELTRQRVCSEGCSAP